MGATFNSVGRSASMRLDNSNAATAKIAEDNEIWISLRYDDDPEDAKKKAKLLAKEAKIAIKTILANHKKQEKIQLKMKATIAKKEAKSEIVKLNKTIYTALI